MLDDAAFGAIALGAAGLGLPAQGVAPSRRLRKAATGACPCARGVVVFAGGVGAVTLVAFIASPSAGFCSGFVLGLPHRPLRIP